MSKASYHSRQKTASRKSAKGLAAGRRWAGDAQAMGRRWVGDAPAMRRRWAGDGPEMGRRRAGDAQAMRRRWADDRLEMRRRWVGDAQAMSRTVSRVLYPTAIYLWRRVSASLKPPPRDGTGCPLRPSTVLLQAGFTEPASRQAGSGPLPHFSTLAERAAPLANAARRALGGIFLLHFP